MEIKEQNEFPFVWVEKRVKSKKPLRNKNGEMRPADALKYLVRVLPQDTPSYDFILNLASFSASGHLSEKQLKKATEIVWFYEDEGVL